VRPRAHPDPRGGTPDPLPLRDRLAVERTRLANERTFLAYARTALALLAGGATLLLFVSDVADGAGIALLVLGAAVVLLGLRRFTRVRRRITTAEARSVAEATGGEKEEGERRRSS
jgi:putative membrane protein